MKAEDDENDKKCFPDKSVDSPKSVFHEIKKHELPNRSRLFKVPPLEKKHSSGDLLSRLKTRKILGVGETDNGDIHRSKISQVLGHNEHLYVKLPKGYWFWHLSMATYLSGSGIMGMALPNSNISVALNEGFKANADTSFLCRLHGASVFSLSVILWSTLGTNDKATAKTSLLGIILYNSLHIIAEVTYIVGTRELTTGGVFSMVSKIVFSAVSTCFYHLLSSHGSIPGNWTKKINCLNKDVIQEDSKCD